MLEYLYDRAEELWTRRKVRSRRIHFDDVSQPFWRRWWGNAENNEPRHIKPENEVDKLEREIAFLSKSLEKHADERGIHLLSELTDKLDKHKRKNKPPSPPRNTVKTRAESRSAYIDIEEGVDELKQEIHQWTEYIKTNPDDENAVIALSALTAKLEDIERRNKSSPKNTTVKTHSARSSSQGPKGNDHDRIQRLQKELAKCYTFISTPPKSERERERQNTCELEIIPKIEEELYRLTGDSQYKEGEIISFEDKLASCGIPAIPITNWNGIDEWDGFVNDVIKQHAMRTGRPNLQRIKTDEYPNLIAIYGTLGDGHCLVHSFLIMISESYRRIVSDADKTRIALTIRARFLSMYDETEWLQDGALAYLCHLFGVNAIVYRTRTHSDPATLQVYKNDGRHRPFLFIHNQAPFHYSGAGYDGNCITSWAKGNELLARLNSCGVPLSTDIDYEDRDNWKDPLLKSHYRADPASIPVPW
jgi:hypothetical protein